MFECVNVVGCPMDSGTEFQMTGPATENALSLVEAFMHCGGKTEKLHLALTEQTG